ncbi:MAG: haloacid dehalogenase-like hydrolase [Acidobacteria bacterium]|nr:haloacid dehalogenase-like hydrolase [Acidobacteriota bacterium]
MSERNKPRKNYILASDFDHTLSFNDSGIVLSELLETRGFQGKVDGLAKMHFVQQGGELAYLLLHDPEYRRVRKEHLWEVGKRIRLKRNIGLLAKMLEDLDGCHFSFHVISAAPEEVIQSALEGIVPRENIHGTKLCFNPGTGEIERIAHVGAGYGKVAVLEEICAQKSVTYDRVVYVGDGSSDVHVMLNLNRHDGLTIAVSENKFITQIAKRTVLSDDALSVLVPVCEEILGWESTQIRALFDSHGLALQGWSKVRTDSLTITERNEAPAAA